MPEIYDNINTSLLSGLRPTLEEATRADICVGYFNLRGWRKLVNAVDNLPEDGGGCRLLVGMQRLPSEELRDALRLRPDGTSASASIDNTTANRLKREAAAEFRRQLTFGFQSNEDEATLRCLVSQLRSGHVTVKLHTRYPLHAKLYLLHRQDKVTPIVGYLGSSNLTLAGLSGQGELNIDVVDRDAACKLQTWFEDRWADRFCLDITSELADIIDESWARKDLLPPYHVYLKMAYHLSEDAREGVRDFRIPKVFGDMLFDFQIAAVKIAARHLNKRGGVLIGDVVGLGKTLMATALARIMQEDSGDRTLILCPKNLEQMWNWYREQYGLDAKVIPFSRVIRDLPELSAIRPYQLVLIDESHNLRNREGKQYAAIRDYIDAVGSRCILLSATPYNKQFLDLGAQLRLFVSPDADLGIRPEAAIREAGGDAAFTAKKQVNLRTLAAFEESEFTDDWRELMRRYLVRRTRSFIQTNYAKHDEAGRAYLEKSDGTRDYFPLRVPRTVAFETAPSPELHKVAPSSLYARLVADDVVARIDALSLPRYGLGGYVAASAKRQATPKEAQIIENLSRARSRLKGFCRVNLFKRLESSGWSFLLSVERHALRNYVYLHALEQGLPVPIGTQDANDLPIDPATGDIDMEAQLPVESASAEPGDEDAEAPNALFSTSEATFERRAKEVYDAYAQHYSKRFQWLPAERFTGQLAADLRADARNLLAILRIGETWNASDDPKLSALIDLIGANGAHPHDKVLIFTQFADTAHYLVENLRGRVPGLVEAVTGAASDPTSLARRFSPISNRLKRAIPDEIRVLVTTDVLSEGQNLQDAHIVVNYDLPWAIIRLVQRVGRVDRIGQQAREILCYSFLPAEGIENVIRLRQRVKQRLHENAEVVGADERFFEDDDDNEVLLNLFHEKAGVLDDDEDDDEVDLASYAFQIWQNATAKHPGLRKAVEALPEVVYSTKAHAGTINDPDGVLLYLRTAQGADALVRVDEHGTPMSYSPLAVLRAAECDPETPAQPRQQNHHWLVKAAAQAALKSGGGAGGGLGRTTGARYRAYTRLKSYSDRFIFDVLIPDDIRRELPRALEEMLRYPLTERARTALGRQMRIGITDEQLAWMVLELRAEQTLFTGEPDGDDEAQIICSLGLAAPEE